jgi:hypothetical protein
MIYTVEENQVLFSYRNSFYLNSREILDKSDLNVDSGTSLMNYLMRNEYNE